MCRNQFDGNCTKPVEHQKCEYISAVQTLELIMGTQKFCVLCQNVACKNSITLEAACEPVWNGMRIGGWKVILWDVHTASLRQMILFQWIKPLNTNSREDLDRRNNRLQDVRTGLRWWMAFWYLGYRLRLRRWKHCRRLEEAGGQPRWNEPESKRLPTWWQTIPRRQRITTNRFVDLLLYIFPSAAFRQRQK